MPTNWDALAMGLCVLAYWARVLKMAWKLHRRARSAHLLPPERTGRLLRIAWYPLVTFWCMAPLLRAWNADRSFAFANLWVNPPVVAWSLVAIAALALVGSIICWKTMAGHWRMGIDPAERNTLLQHGPFAIVRHPIYSLSAVMMGATAAALASPAMLVAAAAHIALLAYEARREERHLTRVHGSVYTSYCRRVGALLPRLFKAEGGGHDPS